MDNLKLIQQFRILISHVLFRKPQNILENVFVSTTNSLRQFYVLLVAASNTVLIERNKLSVNVRCIILLPGRDDV